MPNIPKFLVPLVQEASKSAGAEFPFWETDDLEIAEEGMWQLAFELDVENVELFLFPLPAGYSIVYWIFEWEGHRAGEGFCTGTDNSGVGCVHNAANSYELIGMSEEANALRAMLAQLEVTPDKYECVEAAYNAVPNPYKEDWERFPYLVKTLCANAEKYFYTA
jgi:hypothetical protein